MVKDQEFLKSKASYCLDLAKKMGATDASVTVGHSISETVNFRNKSLEASDRSDGLALSIETYLGKRKSSISSSNGSGDEFLGGDEGSILFFDRVVIWWLFWLIY